MDTHPGLEAEESEASEQTCHTKPAEISPAPEQASVEAFYKTVP